jgi:UDP-glucose 4-epimerase
LNYLLIGGGGFIGHNVVNTLVTRENATISIVDYKKPSSFLNELKLEYFQFDANDINKLTATIERVKPECIFHLAANSDIGKSALNPQFDASDTFGTTNSLIHALSRAEHNADVVFSSTSAVYGLKKEKISEGTIRTPISSYGWMKYASEEMLVTAQKIGIVSRLLIARFPNVTGKFQTHGIIFDFINKLLFNNRTLQVLGDGNQTKPYMSAEVLSEILWELIQLDWQNQLTINIGPDDPISVKKIVSILKEVSNLDFEPVYEESETGWPGDVPNYLLDTSLLRELLTGLNIPSSEVAITESIALQLQNS